MITESKNTWYLKLINKYNVQNPPNCNYKTLANLLVTECEELSDIPALKDLASSGDEQNTELLVQMLLHGDFKKKNKMEEFKNLTKQLSIMKEEEIIKCCNSLVSNKIMSKEDLNEILTLINKTEWRFDLTPSNALLF